MSEIVALKNALRANPIYNLSLGSHELFHSKFLAWLFETYPQMLEALTGGEQALSVVVKREERNLDLIVNYELDGQALSIVLEVKVKDAPRPEQLKKYNAKIQKMKDEGRVNQHVKKILLALVPITKDQVWSELIAETSEEDTNGWIAFDFATLGKKILAISKKSQITADHRSIIDAYAEMCRDLSALFQLALKEDKGEQLRAFVVKPERNKTEEALKDLGSGLIART